MPHGRQGAAPQGTATLSSPRCRVPSRIRQSPHGFARLRCHERPPPRSAAALRRSPSPRRRRRPGPRPCTLCALSHLPHMYTSRALPSAPDRIRSPPPLHAVWPFLRTAAARPPPPVKRPCSPKAPRRRGAARRAPPRRSGGRRNKLKSRHPAHKRVAAAASTSPAVARAARLRPPDLTPRAHPPGGGTRLCCAAFDERAPACPPPGGLAVHDAGRCMSIQKHSLAPLAWTLQPLSTPFDTHLARP
jgi:hypothetical protein